MKISVIALVAWLFISFPVYAATEKSFTQKLMDILFQKGNVDYVPAPRPPGTGSLIDPTSGVETPYEIPIGINDGKESEYADAIVSIITQDCVSQGPGIVTKDNVIIPKLLNKQQCIYRIKEVMNNVGIAEIENSVNAFYYIQCVGCVRSMAKARGIPYNGTGAAKQHINQTVAGYDYFENTTDNYEHLVPGAIGIAREGTYGHIFYIVEVIRDSNGVPKKYRAFECNYGASGLVRANITRVVQAEDSTGQNYLVGWQKPKSL